MSNKSALINVIQSGISKISRRLLRDFGEIESLQLSHDKLERFVLKSISFIQVNLEKYFVQCRPNWEVIFATNNNIYKNFDKDKYYWLIDPISGFENFKRGIPIFGISIAVVKENETIVSSIFDPIRDEFYFAEKGKGAYLNERRIRVSNREFLKNSLISLESDTNEEKYKKFITINEMTNKNFRYFLCSSLSLAWVACGKIDSFFCSNINQPTFECGKLIIREAGGYYSQFNSEGKNGILIANPKIHKNLTKLLNS